MYRRKAISQRAKCPCCKFPTLDSLGDYEICELCNWEDDGQNDSNAEHILLFSPNHEYSLKQARENFGKYRVMYSPDGYNPIGKDNVAQFRIKGKLMQTFKRYTHSNNSPKIEKRIERLEDFLDKEGAKKSKKRNLIYQTL